MVACCIVLIELYSAWVERWIDLNPNLLSCLLLDWSYKFPSVLSIDLSRRSAEDKVGTSLQLLSPMKILCNYFV